jgi:hypothetical protein
VAHPRLGHHLPYGTVGGRAEGLGVEVVEHRSGDRGSLDGGLERLALDGQGLRVDVAVDGYAEGLLSRVGGPMRWWSWFASAFGITTGPTAA